MDAHLADVAARHPDRPLILTDDVTLSYADVVERSEHIAKGLRRLGVRAGAVPWRC
ncbi:AMP-binding protein, partial [Klebsiella aerogenes]|uniref:AMP-binding protein n=1 Tax=Klebsiella aerogenes TaxID=548 RepID=UPI0034D4F194